MTKRVIFNRQTVSEFLYSALCISFLFFLSCGEGIYSYSETGSIAFSIAWQDAPVSEPESGTIRAASLDCGAAGVTTVTFDVYDSSGTYLTGASWPCSYHQGTVSGVPAGSNRRLVVSGEDSVGNVLYQGEKAGITVIAGQTTNVGTIQVAPVSPTTTTTTPTSTTTTTTTPTSTTTTTTTIPSWTMLKLPDTGQTQSYTSIFGEDSDYTINPPSYRDNGNGTVTDNVTGLMWQQEDDDILRTWDQTCTYCDNLSLAGYSDWRLPSKKEFMSIVDYGTYNPSIDTTYFLNMNASCYWSSTTYAYNASYAWYVYFFDGYVGSFYKSSTYYVRCVRGGQ
jgi:hypothetical protein